MKLLQRLCGGGRYLWKLVNSGQKRTGDWVSILTVAPRGAKDAAGLLPQLPLLPVWSRAALDKTALGPGQGLGWELRTIPRGVGRRTVGTIVACGQLWSEKTVSGGEGSGFWCAPAVPARVGWAVRGAA